MIFVIGQATVQPVDGGGGDSGGNQHGGTGQPPPDNEGREFKMIMPPYYRYFHTMMLRVRAVTGLYSV